MTGWRPGRLIVLVLVLAACAAISLLLGGSGVGAGDLLDMFRPEGMGKTASIILWQIRTPRIALGLVVGAGLGVTGAVLQGMLRNPLAESYTLGVSGGAALGAIAGSLLLKGVSLGGFLLPLSACAGALASTVCVYILSSRGRFSISTLILGGIVLNLLLSSVILLLFSLSRRERVFGIILWLMGDLSSADAGILLPAALCVGAGTILLLAFARDLNVLTMGEEKAAYLGMDVETVHRILFTLTSLVAGACVSAAGIVGFVGLMIPHAVRRFLGPDHRAVLPGSFLAGGAFLVLCDALARSVAAPIELPVGVITGIVGGGYFLFQLVAGRTWDTFSR